MEFRFPLLPHRGLDAWYFHHVFRKWIVLFSSSPQNSPFPLHGLIVVFLPCGIMRGAMGMLFSLALFLLLKTLVPLRKLEFSLNLVGIRAS